MVLAVDKINISSTLPIDSSEDFFEIVSNISRLRHPNITELVGYCSEHGQHLLVYEFHKNGSLHDLLHLSDDDARALEYLHEVCSPSVVHKSFKSANILLDKELNPHLSAFGLANLVPDANLALNDNDGSGCRAPEVEMSGQYTIKSDIYSFGVVMLELLSGRKSYDRCHYVRNHPHAVNRFQEILGQIRFISSQKKEVRRTMVLHASVVPFQLQVEQ